MPVIREGFERAITEQPQVGSVFSNMARSSIDQASNLATSMDPESIKRLFEEIITALDEGAFEKVIETVDQAIAACDEVIARFGGSDSPDLQKWVAWALFYKGIGQINMDHVEEALRTCEEIEIRLDALTGNEKIKFTWRIGYMRAFALLVQEKYRDALEAFRSAHAAFPPNNEAAMREMQEIVPNFIATGASERDLVEILSSDKEKADALVPLIVAL
ncbi:MAG: hypothetical protein J4F29_20745, partial [Candidatus Latescibacteria bacterium]|nr:hypothetical protein [Candidatus Latescibacterota bacterium]